MTPEAAIVRSVLDPDTVVGTFLSEYPPESTPDTLLRGARFDAGLAFPHFLHGRGGQSWPLWTESAVEQSFLKAGAVDWSGRNIIGLGMAAPTLHEHGDDGQRTLLRPLFTGDHVWCQLFSEPGSGSDLASVSTRADLEGDCWRVSGQKVWTTLAHVARWGLLLARTDAHAPKHQGLTFFILDMTAPGVEVRPLRQMTGESEFNEVYLTEVPVPRHMVLGGVGNGWRVAMTTLSNERTSLSRASDIGGRPIFLRAVEAYRQAQKEGRISPIQTDHLIRLWSNAEVLELTLTRASKTPPSMASGPFGALGKLAMADLNKSLLEFVVTLRGPAGMLIDNYDDVRPDTAILAGAPHDSKAFLRTRANSIEGGTSEVLRTTLAERILGLPPEPRVVPRDIPWSQIPRGPT